MPVGPDIRVDVVGLATRLLRLRSRGSGSGLAVPRLASQTLRIHFGLLGVRCGTCGLRFAFASFWMLSLYYLYGACAFALCYCERALNSARGLAHADADGRVEDA